METTPDNPQKGALVYGPVVLAGKRGTEGMQAPATHSNPALYNDYYTYDYHIPAGLRTTLTLDVKHPERSVPRVGTELKFTTSQGDVIEPLYNIHLNNHDWMPIGTTTNPLRANYDGGGYEIIDLKANVTQQNGNSGRSSGDN